ncbi:DUF6119 family protein [Amycolatopsis sp. cg5]|uniref:DUF6119 family protein n=1 Tax=Amycolatopsis sp. cg5 TaxID=3238802 RepID=UPI0035232C7D
MSHKRSNSAIWKISLPDDTKPQQQAKFIIDRYRTLSTVDPTKHKPLREIALLQSFGDVEMSLYVRSRMSLGFLPFVQAYLAEPDDQKYFRSSSKDALLFIATSGSLFAVTSGAGHRVIEDYVDYTFPFDTAKRLIANNFKAADVREFAGPRTSRTETYRRAYSITKSESFGKVWKRLVGRVNTALLAKDSFLLSIINPNRPPALEVKSSFVLRKKLDLSQLISLIREIEDLPAPTPEQLRQLSFLDNLYPVKSKQREDELKEEFIENFRLSIAGQGEIDLDICDPDDVSRYYTGSNFRMSYWPIEGDPPTKEDIIEVLRKQYQEQLESKEAFFDLVTTAKVRYSVDTDEDSDKVTKELYRLMHGQVDLEGQTYFLLDKVWYRSQGDFLENLKKDFLFETFEAPDPILITEALKFTPWTSGDEHAYNQRQAGFDGFYFGDKIFAVVDTGQVELFDLIKVDAGTLYVIHVKEGFDASMRDACSQISVSADVIDADVKNEKKVLSAYYSVWAQHSINQHKNVSQADFLAWFDLHIVYVVVASTREFTAQTFEKNRLRSHIARREIIATRNEFRGLGRVFRLAHTTHKVIKPAKKSSTE